MKDNAIQTVQSVQRLGQRILKNIISDYAKTLVVYMDTVVKETGGTPKSALEYLGELLPEHADEIMRLSDMQKTEKR